MDNLLGAVNAPILDIAVIDDLRTRARSLSDALLPYMGHTREAVPGELRNQVHDLADEANRLIAQAIRRKQGDRWYSAVALARNYYHYRRQAVWTDSDDEESYISYDSCLHAEVCEVIWEPCDWVCWSPALGVKRDFITFFGAPAIVDELANGDILDDMAGLPIYDDERDRAHQEFLEHLQRLDLEPDQRVRNDIYRD